MRRCIIKQISIIKGITKNCNRSRESYFTQYKDFTYTTKKGRYIYIKRGGSCLAVAHLDCVDENSRAKILTDESGELIGVNSIALDDRLGVYIILDMLPILGITDYDILLTDDEEWGCSTASEFTTNVEYNWIFEFDRRGSNSCVMYQYDNIDTFDRLTECAIATEFGSYSDICELEELAKVAINFSCGYHFEHTKKCFALIADVVSSVNRFITFFNKFSQIEMVHVPLPKVNKYKLIGTTPKDWRMVLDECYNNTIESDDGYDCNHGELNNSHYNDEYCISCQLGFHADDLINHLCYDCDQWLSKMEDKF